MAVILPSVDSGNRAGEATSLLQSHVSLFHYTVSELKIAQKNISDPKVLIKTMLSSEKDYLPVCTRRGVILVLFGNSLGDISGARKSGLTWPVPG